MGFGATTWGGPGGAGSSVAGVPLSDLIYHALRAAGVTLLAGRTPSEDQYSDGLKVFNRMTGWLNTLSNAIFTRRIDVWRTAPNTRIYTLGPGGDWDGPRPQRIEYANLFLSENPIYRKELRIWDDAQWKAIHLQDVFTYPEGLYNDGAAGLANIYFHPAPDKDYGIELYTWQALSKASTVNDELVYPDGYEEMLVGQLAVRFMPMYRKRLNSLADDQLVITQAQNSLSAVIKLNANPPRMSHDAELAPRRGGLYNWKSGLVEP